MSNKGNKTDWPDTLRSFVLILFGGVNAIGGSYYATQFQTSSQSHVQKVEEQRRAFSKLMGKKFTTIQIYQSLNEAILFFHYNEEIWKRAGRPAQNSFALQESMYWKERSQNRTSDVVKNNEELFEDVATVQALFPDTPRLRDLCDRIYNLHSLEISDPPPDIPTDKLDNWKNGNQHKMVDLVEQEYGKPIDELLDYLLPLLPSD